MFYSNEMHKTVGALGLAIGWLFLIPFSPEMPSAGLDPSWRYALNVAVSEGLVFGRDLIFTFGPLGSVYTHVYSPQTDHLMMVGSALYGAAFCAMLGLAAYPRRPLIALSVPILIALNIVRDPFFIAVPFLLLFNVTRVLRPESSSLYLKPTRTVIALLALGAVAIGMAPIIKGSFSGVVAPIAGITALTIARKTIRGALAFIALVVASLFSWWAICGQPLTGLLQFFIAQSPLILGYTGAMSLSNKPIGPSLFVLASALVCVLLFFRFRKEDRLNGWAILLASAWTLFVAFKGGFVRHDGHAFIAAGALLFLAYGATCVLDTTRASAVVLVSGIAAVVAVKTVFPADKHFLTAQITNGIIKTKDGIVLRSQHSAELRKRYKSAVEAIRAEQSLPRVSGTVDIYPLELSAIFSNDLRWSGRPIFQSYSAYTPVLLKLNADHLIGSRAPDNAFFMLNPIDHRMPTFDDSNSLIRLMSRYNIVGYTEPYIHMERSATPNETHFVESDARSEAVSWSQTVPVDRHRPSWVSIDMERSVFGRVVEFLFKLPKVEIELTFTDGTAVRHRYIPEIGRSGFIISPYLAATTDIIDLAAGLPGREVKSFKLVTRYPFLWSSTIGIRMMPISIAAQDGARAIVLTHPARTPPAPLLRGDVAANVECAIDAINGSAYRSGEVSAGARSMLRAQGWTMPHVGSDARVFDTWIVASSPRGERLYFKAPHQKRPDVAEAFKRADLSDSGFNIALDTASLADHRTIEIFTASNDVAYRCSQSIQVGG
jgi:hypothetical protein